MFYPRALFGVSLAFSRSFRLSVYALALSGFCPVLPQKPQEKTSVFKNLRKSSLAFHLVLLSGTSLTLPCLVLVPKTSGKTRVQKPQEKFPVECMASDLSKEFPLLFSVIPPLCWGILLLCCPKNLRKNPIFRKTWGKGALFIIFSPLLRRTTRMALPLCHMWNYFGFAVILGVLYLLEYSG